MCPTSVPSNLVSIHTNFINRKLFSSRLLIHALVCSHFCCVVCESCGHAVVFFSDFTQATIFIDNTKTTPLSIANQIELFYLQPSPTFHVALLLTPMFVLASKTINMRTRFTWVLYVTLSLLGYPDSFKILTRSLLNTAVPVYQPHPDKLEVTLYLIFNKRTLARYRSTTR